MVNDILVTGGPLRAEFGNFETPILLAIDAGGKLLMALMLQNRRRIG
jgi:hypothetical protein